MGALAVVVGTVVGMVLMMGLHVANGLVADSPLLSKLSSIDLNCHSCSVASDADRLAGRPRKVRADTVTESPSTPRS